MPYSLMQSARQQLRVLRMAHRIFVTRNEIRKDLWAQSDPQKHFDMVDEKLKRARINYQDGEPIDGEVLLDDLLDALNYIVFIIRRLLGWVPPNG